MVARHRIIAAPRLDPRLLDQLIRHAGTADSPAEIRRGLVSTARELGLAAPSYEHVRRLVGVERDERAERKAEAILPVVVDVALGVRHGNELLRVARGETPARPKTK